MVKYVKQSKKNLKMIIFLLTLSLKRKVINFISKLPTNKASDTPSDTLMTLVFILKQSVHVYCSKLTSIISGCLKNKMFLNNLEKLK